MPENKRFSDISALCQPHEGLPYPIHVSGIIRGGVEIDINIGGESFPMIITDRTTLRDWDGPDKEALYLEARPESEQAWDWDLIIPISIAIEAGIIAND